MAGKANHGKKRKGTEATFIYTGEFKDDGLAGDVAVKGFEDQYKGTWTAKR